MGFVICDQVRERARRAIPEAESRANRALQPKHNLDSEARTNLNRHRGKGDRTIMSNKTQADRVFATLRAEIVGCRLQPGVKLRINDIAAESEVSLGAVREALSRLGAEGLVIAESQKGYHVAPLSIADFRDLTDARIEIERISLARSIANGDLEWETNLVAAWHRLSRTSEGGGMNPRFVSDQWALAHAGFHQALVNACGSAKLLQIRAQLYEQAERYRRYSGFVVNVERNVAAEHQRIFEATIGRDSAAATEAIAEHLRLTADIIITSPVMDTDENAPKRAQVG